MSNRYVVIMAGGKGERFWPQSTLSRPKHLLPIVGEKAMLVQTIDRLEGVAPLENVLIITNAEQVASVKELCPDLSAEQIIGEPVGRDTAAAVGLATFLIKQKNPAASFAILPADHVIHDHQNFANTLNFAFSQAEERDTLVTVGIDPDYPATGYGYIHKGEQLQDAGEDQLFAVQRFVEKPDLETAQSYIDSGEYFWNAGMFVWQVQAIEAALQEFTPSLHKALAQLSEALASGENFDLVLEKEYPQLEKISIDYAVMEKAQNVTTIPARFDWDDVGEWPAIERHHEKDAAGNTNRAQVVAHSSNNNIIVGENDHLIALVGVEDLIVVQTKGATLICHKDKAQDIKQVVQAIGKDQKWQNLL